MTSSMTSCAEGTHIVRVARVVMKVRVSACEFEAITPVLPKARGGAWQLL